MKFDFKEFFHITKEKILISFIIIIIITPFINILFYDYVGFGGFSLKPLNYHLTWGIYPCLIMSIQQDCVLPHACTRHFYVEGYEDYCNESCHKEIKYRVYSITARDGYTESSDFPLLNSRTNYYGVFITPLVELIFNLVISLILSYIITCAIVIIHQKQKMKKNNKIQEKKESNRDQ